jgi:IS5 family transposase
MVLRLLILKHIRNWCYEVLEREVLPNLVYRDFTHVGSAKMPDAKTIGRWGLALGPEVIKQIHARLVKIAQDNGLAQGRKMRKLRVLDIARAARAKGKPQQERLKQAYGQLLNSTSRVVGQARRFSKEIAEGVKRATNVLHQLALEGLRQEFDAMVPLVKQVMKQTSARIFHANTRFEGKLLSLFEPSTEVIRKGKAAKPNEFGKMVKLQEAENQIVIDYEVYARRPNDSDLLITAIERHQAMLGRTPHLVAADAAFYSSKNEAAAKAAGVRRVCIPNRSSKSPERKREQKKRWFRNGQKWRTGCEGRISVVKRRHGLDRCPIQRRCRNAALGRARRDSRQHHQHRPRNEKTRCSVAASKLTTSSRSSNPARPLGRVWSYPLH